MTWYLISSEDVDKLNSTLQTVRDHERQRREFGECTFCFDHAVDALHTLNTGLHITDAVPSDYLKLTS